MTFRTLSKRINKIRPPIAQHLHLALTLPLNPHIPLSFPPLPILAHQQHALQDAAAQQKHRQICQDGAMTGEESRRIFAAIDVGGHDPVQVAPADDEADGDAALVDALDVVGRPGDGVGDAGVDAQGAEVDSRVLDGGVGGCWIVTKCQSVKSMRSFFWRDRECLVWGGGRLRR